MTTGHCKHGMEMNTVSLLDHLHPVATAYPRSVKSMHACRSTCCIPDVATFPTAYVTQPTGQHAHDIPAIYGLYSSFILQRKDLIKACDMLMQHA